MNFALGPKQHLISQTKVALSETLEIICNSYFQDNTKTCKSGFPARPPNTKSVLRIETIQSFPAFMRIKMPRPTFSYTALSADVFSRRFFHAKRSFISTLGHKCKILHFCSIFGEMIILVTLLYMIKITITKDHSHFKICWRQNGQEY